MVNLSPKSSPPNQKFLSKLPKTLHNNLKVFIPAFPKPPKKSMTLWTAISMKTKESSWWISSMRINLRLRQMTRNHQSWPLKFPIILTYSIKPLRPSLAPMNSYLSLIPIFNQTLTKTITNPNKHQNQIQTKNTSKQCHVIIASSIWKDLSSSRSRKTQNNILSNFQP